MPALREAALTLVAAPCEEVAGAVYGIFDDKTADEQTAKRVELEQLLTAVKALDATGAVRMPATHHPTDRQPGHRHPD